MKKKIDFNQISMQSGLKHNDRTSKKISEDDIAIIGMSCRFPMSDNPDEFWSILRNEVECIRELPENRREDVEKYLEYTEFIKGDYEFLRAGYIDEVDKFDYKFFNMTPNEAKVMDPNQRLFLETAWRTLEDAGYGGEVLRGSRTGVYAGYKSALSNVYQKYIADVQPNLIPVSIFGNKPPMMASRISYFLDLKGPSMIIDTACSATLIALHLACTGIRRGDCDMALVGSCKMIAIPVDGIEENIGIESKDCRTRTFDDNSNGTCPGEGVSAVLIKPLSKAIEAGDNIYAVIKGSAINQDGKSIGIAVPNADAQADVISNAWMDAGVDPETIGYIETHGTATKLGDPIEVSGLKKAFEKFTDKKQFCAIGAVKTNIGHLDNSSSAASFIKTVLSLKNKEIPASINYNVPNRNLDFINSPVYVNYKTKPWKTNGDPRRCGITGVGLNGTNCHVVLEEAVEKSRADARIIHPELFTLSAKTEYSLKQYIKNYKKLLDDKKEVNISDLVYTTNVGKGDYKYRIAFIFESEEEFKEKITEINCFDLDDNKDIEDFYYKVLDDEDGYGSTNIDHRLNPVELIKEAKELVKKFIIEGKEDKQLLKDICKLYIDGADISWKDFYYKEDRQRISTPTYPFEPIRCWVEVPSKKKKTVLEDFSSILGSNILPKDIADELEAVYEKCKKYIDANNLVDGEVEIEVKVKLNGSETNEYTDTERIIAKIWSEMLGYEELNIKHTLFDLGGDSVLAFKIVNKINDRLHTNLVVVDLLKNPTIESISKIIEEQYVRV